MVTINGLRPRRLGALFFVSIAMTLHVIQALEDSSAANETVPADASAVTLDLPTSSVDDSSRAESSSDSFRLDFTEVHVKHITESNAISPASDSWMMTNRDGRILKLQKCCAKGNGLILAQPGEKSTCGESDGQFLLDIYDANGTHYWKLVTSNASNVHIVVNDPCTESKYFLDPNEEDDKFRILYNGSLYYPSEGEMYDTSKYCVDILVGSMGSFVTAVLCTPAMVVSKLHYFYGAGQIVSMAFLSCLAYYQVRRKDIEADHKNCLAWFSVTMAVAYFFMALYAFFESQMSERRLLAYFLYYVILKYFVWLNLLCYDTYRYVRDPPQTNIQRKSYMKRYLLIAFLVPFVFVVITFIDNFKPALPNLYAEYMFSSSIYWCIFLFFVPTGLSAVMNLCIASIIWLPKPAATSKHLVQTMDTLSWTTPPKNLTYLRTMYRRNCILFLLIFMCWLFDLIIFFVPSHGEQRGHIIVRDVLSCLEGFFITGIFIRKDLITSKCAANQEYVDEETSMEMERMNNGHS